MRNTKEFSTDFLIMTHENIWTQQEHSMIYAGHLVWLEQWNAEGYDELAKWIWQGKQRQHTECWLGNLLENVYMQDKNGINVFS